MPKLSVLIPSRNEPYLTQTIEDCFAKAAQEIEVVAVLEGYWPDNWQQLAAKYPNLHTIHHGQAKGMRAAINAAAASAISRGAKYLMKLDAHCMVGEGFDIALQKDCDSDWIVVPRRKRLDPVTWTLKDVGKPDIDYHYLSFPDDPNDFGGPGLNGKVWTQRIVERKDKPEYDIDDEMSSQGSCWFMHAAYFQRMGFMDEKNYGPFWNEFQELGLSCWLSGGQVKVNKKTWYAHWHKSKAGRGYNLPESWLKQGRNFTMNWLRNKASDKQTLPFKTLIERFWPVPSWPENWEELVYGDKVLARTATRGRDLIGADSVGDLPAQSSLLIHSAHYGINGISGADWIDVRERLQSLVKDDSLDIIVNNATLTPDQNPFRGKKKSLAVVYSYDGGEPVATTRQEKDWLIIGQAGLPKPPDEQLATDAALTAYHEVITTEQLSATALNDLLIRRFNIPDRRLRGPMPIEVPSLHRDDLAKLFAELGFNKGVEVGVAEANFSLVLCEANPDLHLLCVDPWHSYKGNPQSKTKEKDEFAYREAQRKLAGYKATLDMRLSMDAVRDVADGSLDFCYVDGHHGFDYCIQDLIEWSKKVRSGGIVAGDDLIYLDEKRWGAGPIEAVQAYVKAHRISPWFICGAPRSVDFFWVRP